MSRIPALTGTLAVAYAALAAGGGTAFAQAGDSGEDVAPRGLFLAPEKLSGVHFDNENGLVYISALVNGQPARFMFVSSWTIDSITDVAAKRLGIIPDQPAGAAPITRTTVARLQIGDGFAVTNDPMAVTPGREGDKVDGILGYGLLRQAVLRFDWNNRRLTFADPAKFSPSPEAKLLPVTILPNHASFVSGEFDGQEARFKIEYGNSPALILEPAFVATNHVRDEHKDTLQVRPGNANDVIRDDSVKAGPFSVLHAYVEVPKQVVPENTVSEADGRIGNAILKHFVVTFDYPDKRLFLEKSDPAPVPAQPVAPVAAQAKTVGDPHVRDSVHAFQKPFVKAESDEAMANLYDTVCTSDFEMRYTPFGTVRKTMSRKDFLTSVRTGSGFSPEVILQEAVAHSGEPAGPLTVDLDAPTTKASQDDSDDEGAIASFWRPDRFELVDGKMIYYMSPQISIASGPSATPKKASGEFTDGMRLTLKETFISESGELRLKSIEIVGIEVRHEGQVLPKAFLDNKDMTLGL